VDNTSDVIYNYKRYAPKLLTKTAYPVGTTWVIDALHLPYGCSVWPSIWTRESNSEQRLRRLTWITEGADWPEGGEIDIFEGVNQVTQNQIALHAANTSCQADSSATFSGNLTEAQCAYDYGDDTGCTVIDDTSDSSYGEAFATAGGGVYVAELGDEGIKVWFFTVSRRVHNAPGAS
jgi:hypothetical protein